MLSGGARLVVVVIHSVGLVGAYIHSVGFILWSCAMCVARDVVLPGWCFGAPGLREVGRGWEGIDAGRTRECM